MYRVTARIELSDNGGANWRSPPIEPGNTSLLYQFPSPDQGPDVNLIAILDEVTETPPGIYVVSIRFLSDELAVDAARPGATFRVWYGSPSHEVGTGRVVSILEGLQPRSQTPWSDPGTIPDAPETAERHPPTLRTNDEHRRPRSGNALALVVLLTTSATALAITEAADLSTTWALLIGTALFGLVSALAATRSAGDGN